MGSADASELIHRKTQKFDLALIRIKIRTNTSVTFDKRLNIGVKLQLLKCFRHFTNIHLSNSYSILEASAYYYLYFTNEDFEAHRG